MLLLKIQSSRVSLWLSCCSVDFLQLLFQAVPSLKFRVAVRGVRTASAADGNVAWLCVMPSVSGGQSWVISSKAMRATSL